MSSTQSPSQGFDGSATELALQRVQYNHQVHLQVGERNFTTSRNTLARESIYFAILFNGEGGEKLGVEKPLVIDADGDLFVHILRYLRRGVLPVYHDKAKGHDHALYLAVLEEAKFYDIPRLEMWLADKNYLNAVRILNEVYVKEGYKGPGIIVLAEDEIEFQNVEVKRGYKCPRSISIHQKPSDCGKLCARKRGPGGNVDGDITTLKAMVVKKVTVFDTQMCLQGRLERDRFSE